MAYPSCRDLPPYTQLKSPCPTPGGGFFLPAHGRRRGECQYNKMAAVKIAMNTITMTNISGVTAESRKRRNGVLL